MLGTDPTSSPESLTFRWQRNLVFSGGSLIPVAMEPSYLWRRRDAATRPLLWDVTIGHAYVPRLDPIAVLVM
jgi:hypothetical protein